MSGKFSLDDYVDVAERIAQFNERYPDGSLQSELVYVQDPPGWLCSASAYRDKDDPRPGMGHAFEPVPGKTPYTRDSEAQNAETAAWGRAIVALGFQTKKIASRQEVKARRDTPPNVELTDKLLGLCDVLGVRQSSEDNIRKHAADETWLRRQIKTAEENIRRLNTPAEDRPPAA